MQLIYDSLSGNTRRFAEKLGLFTGLQVLDINNYTDGEYLLLTYTFGKGEVPVSTQQFLNKHAGHLTGVVSSGSFHWGNNFGKAGKLISQYFNKPLVAVINKSGTQKDIEVVSEWIHGLN